MVVCKYEAQLHNSEIIDTESDNSAIWFENGIGLNRFVELFVGSEREYASA